MRKFWILAMILGGMTLFQSCGDKNDGGIGDGTGGEVVDDTFRGIGVHNLKLVLKGKEGDMVTVYAFAIGDVVDCEVYNEDGKPFIVNNEAKRFVIDKSGKLEISMYTDATSSDLDCTVILFGTLGEIIKSSVTATVDYINKDGDKISVKCKDWNDDIILGETQGLPTEWFGYSTKELLNILSSIKNK